MIDVIVQEWAELAIEDIYIYTAEKWGDEQAREYVQGLFVRFEEIAAGNAPRRTIPASFGINGYVARYRHHLIYWHMLDETTIGIAAILHERMNPELHLGTAFNPFGQGAAPD